MTVPRRTFLQFAVGAAALPAMSRLATAQAYPMRPITIVVPFAAGGGTDTITRILAERMRATLGQPIIVENVSAGAGTVGVGRAARAPADGYTLSIGHLGTHVVNGAIYSLQYDLLKDFQPVALVSRASFLVTAKRSMPANDLQGLIAWLKANPDRASAGTAGVGSGEHVGGLLFQTVTGTRFQFVPYRGGGPAMQDLVAGQIDDDQRPRACASTGAGRQRQGLRCCSQKPSTRSPRYSDRGRSRGTRILFSILACAVGTQGNAEQCHQQTQRCGHERVS